MAPEIVGEKFERMKHLNSLDFRCEILTEDEFDELAVMRQEQWSFYDCPSVFSWCPKCGHLTLPNEPCDGCEVHSPFPA